MKSKWFWLLFALCLTQLPACYVVKQGVGQVKQQFRQIPIENALLIEEDPRFRDLLASVPDVKRFAKERLKLDVDGNYTHYLKVDGEGVVYVVTASPKDKLDPYTWWFPVVGSVPYKGFFSKADAQALEAELKGKGLDTYLFAAPAYSTLGWFRDPVTTPMLRKGQFSLTSTLIHEMVHTTLYVEGEGDFNEQLASFVGTKGALAFLEHKGLLTPDLQDRIAAMIDRRKRLSAMIHGYIGQLEALYNSDVESEQLQSRREFLFEKIRQEAMTIYPNLPKQYWHFNNARVLQYKRYREESPMFSEFWEQSGGDWVRFWEHVNQHVDREY